MTARLRRLTRPAVSAGNHDFLFTSVLVYLEDAGVIDDDEDEYEDLLLDLVEFVGGGWHVIEAGPDLVQQLDPARHDRSELAARYRSMPGTDHPPIPAEAAAERMLGNMVVLRDALVSVGEGSILLIHLR